MKRNKHSLSHYKLATFDMGELVPVGVLDVLPGDSVRMATSALLRLSPLVTPVMHPVTVRIHHWFVPYRIIWDGWEDFITGGPDGLNAETPPKHGPAGTVNPGTIWDYFGIPPGYQGEWSAMPTWAYNLIWNEFYRDQDLQVERDQNNQSLATCAWEKDYFTAARPWLTKGNAVTLPLGPSAPVRTSSVETVTGANPGLKWRNENGNAISNTGTLGTDTSGRTVYNGSGIGSVTGQAFPSNLEADLSLATAASVNDLRLAFALQRYQEARAQYGSRYTEYLRYLGVRSSDARLQRPEYLGGGKSTISFSEVLRTGNETGAESNPIGEMKGHGIAALRTRRFVRFFEEHGLIMSLASVRPRSIYGDGVHRSFLKANKEDYWQRELESIGQQEVYNAEVYANHSDPYGTFGYQDRYSEYRHQPSTVSGNFRTTLNDWHLARQFASAPALNDSFVRCIPSKRIFAEQTQDSLWAMFSHSVQARRMVGHKKIGRVY